MKKGDVHSVATYSYECSCIACNINTVSICTEGSRRPPSFSWLRKVSSISRLSSIIHAGI